MRRSGQLGRRQADQQHLPDTLHPAAIENDPASRPVPDI
jgi:hypothetical protein